MLANSFAFTPDWIMMRTIGTVNTSTKPALSSVVEDSLTALPKEGRYILCKMIVTKHTATSTPPGRYRGWKLPLMPGSPRMSRTLQLTDSSACLKGATVRLSTSTRASNR